MRLNISVPDVLADEVYRFGIPISAVCQRALREEVDRLRAEAPVYHVTWSAVDEAFVATVEQFPACAQPAATPSEALAALVRLLSEWDLEDPARWKVRDPGCVLPARPHHPA